VERQSGKQFDPDCAAAFMAIRDRIIQEMNHQSALPWAAETPLESDHTANAASAGQLVSG
jgi:hypothetical protein